MDFFPTGKTSHYPLRFTMGLPWWLRGKESEDNAGDLREMGSVPGSGRFRGRGNSNPLQYSCLENPMDKGAWQATVYRVTKSQTQLEGLSMHARLELWKWEMRSASNQTGLDMQWVHLSVSRHPRYYCYFLHLTDEEAEAQRGDVTYSRSPS